MAGRRNTRTCIAAAALVLGAAGATVATGSPTGARETAARPARAYPSVGKIKHIIVVYQENRSFDGVLGAFGIAQHRCDGNIGPVRLKGGLVVPLTRSDDVVNPDPPHEMAAQVKAIDGGKMDGWGNLASMCRSPGKNLCLTYYEPSQVPSLTSLAQKYVVSDRTFSMQDSPSWGGHVYAAAATQNGFTGDTPKNVDIYNNVWGCDSKTGSELWKSPQGVMSWQPACIPAPNGFLDPAKYPYNG